MHSAGIFSRLAASAVLGVVLLGGAASAQTRHASRVDLAFNRFYNNTELTEALRQLVRAYPELLSLESIGKSTQGRDLWLVTLHQPRTGSDRLKPAMYIDGNVHGNEVQGAEVCLYTLWYLTKSYGRVEAITELLDRAAFYILPTVNPDGRAFWFSQANTPHSSRGNQVPVDNDRDGVADEDPPDDLDGDGSITEMRIRDPRGRWRASRADARLREFVPVGEGEGEYTYLGLEGIDNDGDDRVNEDGPGGYDMNRNWPADWQPNHIQGGAGDYPLCFPETRAIADFIVAHPNIAAVQSYHNTGGMILRGPGAEYVPEYPGADRRAYDHIAEVGEKLLPHYRYMVIWKDLYTVHGGFINWTYETLGILSFSNELFAPQEYFNRPNASGAWFPSEEDLLEFNDILALGEYYVPWKEFEHPTYGTIEIGGWTQYSSRVPPPFLIEQMAHRNMAFTLYHARQMPQVDFARREVTRVGEHLWAVTVELRNSRVMGSVSAMAARKEIGARDLLAVEPLAAEGGAPALEVLAGGELTDRLRERVEVVEKNPARLWIELGIGGESARSFRWFVRGAGTVRVRYLSDKAGERVIELAVPPPAEPQQPAAEEL